MGLLRMISLMLFLLLIVRLFRNPCLDTHRKDLATGNYITPINSFFCCWDLGERHSTFSQWNMVSICPWVCQFCQWHSSFLQLKGLLSPLIQIYIWGRFLVVGWQAIKSMVIREGRGGGSLDYSHSLRNKEDAGEWGWKRGIFGDYVTRQQMIHHHHVYHLSGPVVPLWDTSMKN